MFFFNLAVEAKMAKKHTLIFAVQWPLTYEDIKNSQANAETYCFDGMSFWNIICRYIFDKQALYLVICMENDGSVFLTST